jgi:hypothetical protein
MANNYTQFSVQVPLRKGKHVHAAAVKLIDEGYEERRKADEEMRYDDLEAIGFEFQYDGTCGDLYLYAEEHGAPDHVVSYIETLIHRRLALEPVYFEWAYTCSKPRPGEFGGGGALITKDKTYWFMPSRYMELKWEKIKKDRLKPKRKKR